MKTQRRSRWARFFSHWNRFYSLWEMRWSLAWQSLMDWLPPDAVDWPRWKPRSFLRLEPLEYRYLLSGGFTEYTATGNPFGVALGPDHRIWYTEAGAATIGAISTSGTIAQYNLPNSRTQTYEIINGPDGALWFTESTPGPPGPPPQSPGPLISGPAASLGRITTSGTITEYSLTGSSTAAAHGLTVGPDGNIWVVESGDDYVDRFTISSSGVSRFALPTGAKPEDITTGPDGNLWLTEPGINKIARVSVAGAITQYIVPTANSQPYGIASQENNLPYTQYGVGSDGGVWFTEYATNKIGRISSGGLITEYPIPTSNSGPQRIKRSPNGALFFVENTANNIAELSNAGKITEMAVPTTGSGVADVAFGYDLAVWFGEPSTNKLGKNVSPLYATQLLNDPFTSVTVPVGLDTIQLNNGDVQARIPIDYQQALGSGGQSPWGGQLSPSDSLLYSAYTANERPIVQAIFQTDPNGSVPTSLAAQLTWSGTAQATVTYSTTGHSAGDTYLLDLQAANAVNATGAYLWSVEVKATYSGGATTDRTLTGASYVVGNTGASLGYIGWTLSSISRLVPVTTGVSGVMWVYGNGGLEFFPSLTTTTYESPGSNAGTLVKNTDGSYTYTSIHHLKELFNSTGLLTSIIDTHGLIVTYMYDQYTHVTEVLGPDGGTTLFQYDSSGRLTTVVEANGGQLLLTPTGSELTGATYPDNSVRVLAYDGNNHLTFDEMSKPTPWISTISYDSGSWIVNNVDNGGGNTFAIKAMNNEGFGGTAISVNQAAGVVTDGLSHTTTYMMDSQGRANNVVYPDGLLVTITLDYMGHAATRTDQLGRITSYVYDGSGYGDLLNIDNPDGGVWTYQYDNTFHHLTQAIDPDGNQTNYTINSTNGDVTKISNALNQVTTLTWSNGLLVSVIDARGNTTTLDYYSPSRLLADVVDPLGNRTTLTYYSNTTLEQTTVTITDARLNATGYIYDGTGRLLQVNDPDTGYVSYAYDALSDVLSTRNQLGVINNYAYDQHGWLTSMTEASGSSVQRTTTFAYDAGGNLTSGTDPRGTVNNYQYDALNRLTTAVADASNLQLTSTMAYDKVGNLLSVTDPLGHVTSFGYDAMNRQTVRIDANGTSVAERTTMTYDKAGNELSVTDPRGTVTCYQYDALNRLTTRIADRFDAGNTNLQLTAALVFDAVGNLVKVTDPAGNITSYAYDADNRLTTAVEAVGTPVQVTTVLAYDKVGNLTSLTDPMGFVTCFQYDVMNRLTTQIADRANLQATTKTAYDAAGNVLSVTDPIGNVTSFGYDALNRLVTVMGAYGTALQRTSAIQYDANDNITTAIDARGTATVYAYDPVNRRTQVTEAAGTSLQAVTTIAYDNGGNVTSVTDPSAMVTCYQYDALNRLTTQIGDRFDANNTNLQLTTTMAYDGANNVVRMTDAANHATSYQYDPLNRLTTQIDGAGSTSPATTVFAYDKDSNLASVTDPTSFVTCYQYDALNRLTTQIDANGTSIQEITTTLYNADNDVTTMIDAAGKITSLSYDSLNRVVSVQDANGNIMSYGYDLNGNVTKVTDPLNHTTTYQYDALNRATTVINAQNNNTLTKYDANDNVVNVIDPNGNTTTYLYDALNRLTTETDALNHSATYAYNTSGDMTSSTNRNGDVINYSYDPLHRLTTEVWLNSASTIVNTLVFAYDGADNLTSASSVQGANTYTETMTYNALNQMTVEQEPFQATLTMTYNAAGDRTQVQDSFNGAGGGTTTYTYDALHRLTTLQFNATGQSPLRADMNYNAQNLVTTLTRYSDLAGSTKVGISVFQYDAGMRLTTIQHESGTGAVLVSMVYAYDQADRVSSKTIAGATTNYGYDAVNQLTTVTNGGGTTSYGYDANGNRNANGYAVATENQMTSDGTWSYTYDSEGNVIRKTNPSTGETWNYGYDNLNELVTVTDMVGTTTMTQATYVYDALGNRIEKDVWTQAAGTTTVTRYAYDGTQVWATMNSSNALQTRYIHGADQTPLLARESSTGTVGWYLTDSQGSVTNITDGSGNVQDTVSYDAYGNFTETAPTVGDQFRYTGAQWDSETGLQYQGARYYDPRTGRWFSQDPLEFAAGDPNLYRYVGNSPTNAVDPSGLAARIVSDTDMVNEPGSGSGPATPGPGLPPWLQGLDSPRHYYVLPADLNGNEPTIQTMIGGNPFNPEPINSVLFASGTEAAGGGDGTTATTGGSGGSPAAGIRVVNDLDPCQDPWNHVEQRSLWQSIWGSRENPPPCSEREWLRTSYAQMRTDSYDPDLPERQRWAADKSKELLQELMLHYATCGTVIAASRAAAPLHHIATAKNWLSDARGGPWSPRFAEIFEKAGLDLEALANKVYVLGHRGPHPEAYHQAVYDRLRSATAGLTGGAYRQALLDELKRLAEECATPGTTLNNLLTKR
jgi:RHS repeat-associated protein